ncbi:MAG TPA: copper chaperone PCu(A)C [Gemmatimonadaceae bacterium]|nr:copper chaperone PCu(A)C [Gemmatimonadaceae bacterium]
MRRAIFLDAGVMIAVAACGTGRAGQGAPAAPEFSTGGITVSTAFIPSPAGDSPAALYFTIANHASVPDTLLSVSTAAAEQAGMHREVMHGASMTMAPVAALPIPAGGVVRFAPGGYHVMLTGLRRRLAPGDSAAVTLEFRHAGQLPIRARVVSYAELERALGTTASSGR